DETVNAQVFAFHLRFYLEPDGTPRVIATRRVVIDKNERLREIPACFDSLGSGAHFVQGFFIDPDWLFGKLPATLASPVLAPSQEFVPAAFSRGLWHPVPGTVVAEARPVRELGFETYARED